VLSTNVAETSVTVPGIRYVVDAGTARISRYSRRLKVQRLPIEPVSQASANQRAGRCGRVAPGICVRLYSEDDFEARPEFTEPEILRTNLAAVILQMTAIGLGDVARFPFVEPPDSASIRDGYALLEELSAISPAKRLTKTGRRLARLPIDPRLGRMILESGRLGCTREVLVIAAALSMQDVRERPADRRERADELHRRFDVPGSDLLSIVALWDHLRDRQRAVSGNAFRRLCRDEFINYLRVREWVDLYSQLRRVAGDLGLRPARQSQGDARPDDVHKAVLSGLLSHVGLRDRRTRDFVGARNARFVIAPGSVLTKRPPEFVMAAELVETNRLYARRCAAIEPEWAEQLGSDLVKRSYGDPRWDEDQGRAVATERVTLYGVPLVSDREVGYDKADEEGARAWFVTKALVEREWDSKHEFLSRNAEFLGQVRRMTDRVRRAELIDDDLLFEFYDDRVPSDVTSGRRFDRWWKDASADEPRLLDLTEDVLEDDLHIRLDDYPDVWRQRDIELPLTYRFAPGEPLDGATVHIPLAALNQIDDVGFDWQIPGFRRDRAEAMVRSLPKSVRRGLIPLGESTERALDHLGAAVQDRPLADALAAALTETSGVEVRPGQFDGESLPDELTMHFVVSDGDGEVRDVGTDLSEIKRRLAPSVRESIAAASSIAERRGIVDWDLGELPQVVESGVDAGLDVPGFPTLLDVGDSVALRIVSTPELQARAMRGGVRRLLILNAAPTRAAVERLLTSAGRLALAGADIPVETIVDDCIAAAVDAAMLGRSLPWGDDEWRALRAEVRTETPALARQALTKAAAVVAAAVRVQQRLRAMRAIALSETVDDANRHLGRLVRPGFVSSAGIDRLDDVERYVEGIGYRLDHLAGAVDRDRRRIEEVRQLEGRYDRLLGTLDSGRAPTPEMIDLGRALEEFRISVFAQQLGAKGQVSAKRLRRELARLEAG
jgi:ATP-dependent helicase HrpA